MANNASILLEEAWRARDEARRERDRAYEVLEELVDALQGNYAAGVRSARMKQISEKARKLLKGEG